MSNRFVVFLLWLAVVNVALGAGLAAATQTRITGLIRPEREARMSPLVEGRVALRVAKEGQAVRQGETLLKLDPELQESRVAVARQAASQTGTIARAERAHAVAAARFKRLEEAPRGGAVPPWELQEAAAQADMAASELRIAQDAHALEQQRLALETTALQQYEIRAPFDGLVSEVTVSDGAPVKRGDTVVVVTDLKRLELVVYVPAEHMARFRVGDAYDAEVVAPISRSVTAKLTFLDRRIDPASRTTRATFIIDNADLSIPSGIEASVVVPGPSQ